MVDRLAGLPRRRFFTRVALPRLVLLVCATIISLYAAFLHPWMMNWGATPAEQTLALPGDEYPLDGKVYSTRAITIHAPASVVWQWLVQHGQDRAGFYSNDYLENMVGANIHNADELRPEWLRRTVGDKVPMARPDILGGAPGDALFLTIKAMEPERVFVTVDGNNLPARWFLVPVDAGTTRVLVREMSFASTMGEGFTFWVWDPMHFVMEQRMLRGLKERAEGVFLVPGWLTRVAAIGWVAAGGVVAGAFLSRRRWAIVGLLCGAIMIPSLSSTGDLNGALAGFLALGISALGLLAFGRRWILAYPLVAASVLLVLLLSPDSWTVFGLGFASLAAGSLAWIYLRGRARRAAPSGQRLAVSKPSV